MIFLFIIFTILAIVPGSKVDAIDSIEYMKDNVLTQDEFEEVKLYTRFLIDNAPVSVKPVLESKFRIAFTTKWKMSDEFNKFVSGFLDDLESQVLKDQGKIEKSRSKRNASYGSQGFYRAVYALYIVLNAKEEDRPILTDVLIEAQKRDWNNLEEFRNYSDEVAQKILKQHDDELDPSFIHDF